MAPDPATAPSRELLVAEAVAADPPAVALLQGTEAVGPPGVASLHAGGRHGWRLPATPVSISAVRRRLRAVLAETDLPEGEVYDLLLAACEAATNAIEHAQEPTEPFVEVLFEIADGQVTIVVRDSGRWRHGPGTPFRGRGLSLMRDLADTTVDALPHGTTVTIRRRAGADGLPTDGSGGS